MTYIELINEFWKRDKVDPTTAMEAKFYFYLLDECNIRKWINPFELQTRISEIRLLISRKTIGEVRNKLKQRGLIDFVATNNKPTIYLLQDVPITDECLLNCFPQVTIKKHLRLQLGNIHGNNQVTLYKNKDIYIQDYKKEDNVGGIVMCRDEVVESYISQHGISLDQFCKNENISLNQYREIMKEVLTDWELQGWSVGHIRDGNLDFESKHLLNAIRVKKQKSLDTINVRIQKEKFLNDSNDTSYQAYLKWTDENLPYVASHLMPLSEEEFLKLKAEYGTITIRKNLQNLENRQDLRINYTSLYRTLLNWCKNGYNT